MISDMSDNRKLGTITYVNQADGTVLDSETTDAPIPREGQPVMFLGQDGIYRVRSVAQGVASVVSVGRVD